MPPLARHVLIIAHIDPQQPLRQRAHAGVITGTTRGDVNQPLVGDRIAKAPGFIEPKHPLKVSAKPWGLILTRSDGRCLRHHAHVKGCIVGDELDRRVR